MADSIEIIDPVTGDPLPVQATRANCFMVIGVDISTYEIPRMGAQHTGPLNNVLVDEALSHCMGVSLLTNFTKGQAFSTEANGTTSKTPTSLTT